MLICYFFTLHLTQYCIATFKRLLFFYVIAFVLIFILTFLKFISWLQGVHL